MMLERNISVDINPNSYDSNLIKDIKYNVVDEMIKFSPEWRKSKNKIHDDIPIEVKAINDAHA